MEAARAGCGSFGIQSIWYLGGDQADNETGYVTHRMRVETSEDGVTVCSKLKDLPQFETLRHSDHLERLISTGWLERAL